MRISSVGLTICKHSFNEKKHEIILPCVLKYYKIHHMQIISSPHNLQSNLKSDYGVLQIIFVLQKLTASIFTMCSNRDK